MYRLTVGCVVINYENPDQIFLGLKKAAHIGSTEYWNMPQGGIEKEESAREAAARELLEETGISDVEWVAETDWYVCKLPENIQKPKRYESLVGQKHKWFLCFCKEKPSIVLCQQEYVRYEWVSRDEILERIRGSFKEGLYRYVFSKFGPSL